MPAAFPLSAFLKFLHVSQSSYLSVICWYSVTSCNVPEYLVQSQFLSLTLLRCFQYFYYILKFLIPQDAITHLRSVLPAPPWKGTTAVILPVQLILCGQFDGSLIPVLFLEIRGQPGDTIFPGKCLSDLVNLRRIFQRADGQGRGK